MEFNTPTVLALLAAFAIYYVWKIRPAVSSKSLSTQTEPEEYEPFEDVMHVKNTQDAAYRRATKVAVYDGQMYIPDDAVWQEYVANLDRPGAELYYLIPELEGEDIKLLGLDGTTHLGNLDLPEKDDLVRALTDGMHLGVYIADPHEAAVSGSTECAVLVGLYAFDDE